MLSEKIVQAQELCLVLNMLSCAYAHINAISQLKWLFDMTVVTTTKTPPMTVMGDNASTATMTVYMLPP